MKHNRAGSQGEAGAARQSATPAFGAGDVHTIIGANQPWHAKSLENLIIDIAGAWVPTLARRVRMSVECRDNDGVEQKRRVADLKLGP